ncbi:hypothetical protein J6590_035602 [Homalodisca vitripennis]|nr:hypothetical protein J6590_035602 [Homalodisca vitripennis]
MPLLHFRISEFRVLRKYLSLLVHIPTYRAFVLSPSAANEAIAAELIEERNTPSCSLVGATYTDTMKGNATQSPSIRPSEAYKPISETVAQISASSIDITSLSSQPTSVCYINRADLEALSFEHVLEWAAVEPSGGGARGSPLVVCIYRSPSALAAEFF